MGVVVPRRIDAESDFGLMGEIPGRGCEVGDFPCCPFMNQ